MTLKFIARKEEAEGVFSFFFEPPKRLQWRAGQYLGYTLDHANPDKRGMKRYFSIASAPFEKNVMITTRIDQKKESSFKKALINLEKGDSVEATGPYGDFILENPKQEFVFVAGGIGITPFRAILLDLDHKKIPVEGTLLYMNRTPNPIYQQELEQISSKNPKLAIRYVVEPGRITPKILRALIPDFSKPSLAGSKSIFYLSGPPAMMQAVENMLEKFGVPSSHIKEDYFTGYAD